MKNNDPEIKKIIEEEIQSEFIENRNELRMKAKDDILKIQEENKKTFNAKRKPAIQYKKGDLVAISKTQFETGAKFKKKNHGPYQVTKVKEKDRYSVEKVGTHDGPFKTSTSADNMTPWGKINILKSVEGTKFAKQLTISIEGNIGSGKSTFVKYLSKFSEFQVFEEPVKEWQNFNGINLLKESYENPGKCGFTFQSYTMLTMLKIHMEEQNSRIKFME